MAVTITTEENSAQAHIEGELTIFTALETFEQLRAPVIANQDLVIDLSEVTEMDSAGLQILLSLKQETIKRKTTLSLVAHSEAVAEMLTISDLVSFFGDPLVIESEMA